jgi:hypothetical protein
VETESQRSTRLEYLIDLIVRRTIDDHGGDLNAASDALQRSNQFGDDEEVLALWKVVLKRYGITNLYAPV